MLATMDSPFRYVEAHVSLTSNMKGSPDQETQES